MKATNLMQQLDVQTKELAQEQIQILGEAFIPVLDTWDKLQENYTDIISKSCTTDVTPALSKAAKAVRLKMAKVRTTTEKIRKQQKAESLRTITAIDGLARFIKNQLQPLEEKLKEVENYEEIQEQQKVATLQTERLTRVYDIYEQFDAPISEGLINTPYGEMHADVFEGSLQVLRSNLEREQKQIELREQKEIFEREKYIEVERQERLKAEQALQIEAERLAELDAKLKLETAALKSKDDENARQKYMLRQKLKEEQERKDKAALIKANEAAELERKRLSPDRDQVHMFWEDVLRFIQTRQKVIAIKDHTLDDIFKTNVQAFMGKIKSEIANWE